MKIKYFIFKLLHIWILCGLLFGWVLLFDHFWPKTMAMKLVIVSFILAPISEELFYRWLPVQLEKQFPKLGYVPGVLANFFFIGIHASNYPYHGWYVAFAVQGVAGFLFLYLCRKYGVWASMLMHCSYNIACHYLF